MKPGADKDFFAFETCRFDKDNRVSYYFRDPAGIMTLKDPSRAEEFFKKVEELSGEYWVAGFLSYELGYLFEDVFRVADKPDFPYAVFGVFREPRIAAGPLSGRFLRHALMTESGGYKIDNIRLNITGKSYMSALKRIKAHISAGDIYQANFTMKYLFGFRGSVLDLYEDLKKKQKVSYNVCAKLGGNHILSLSPELFFRKRGDSITVKPMKGTAARGTYASSDAEKGISLGLDGKNRSENLMIVDLLRNDLSRISRPGTVKVKKLFEVEKYDTLFQMTSTITGRLNKGVVFYDLVRSLFPSGSVTGAPKIRSMQIIRSLEKEPRRIYTGAMGFIRPGGDAVFNVAIRTVLIRNGKGEMGVGGGIVHDSQPAEEFGECRLKAGFLTQKPVPDFELIETLLFDGGYRYGGLHLDRMRDSADYFGFRFERKKISEELGKMKGKMGPGAWKVRLLLSGSGRLRVFKSRVRRIAGDPRITLSRKRVCSKDKFLYHKTTNRNLYDDALGKARGKGFFDVVFVNELGQVTEGAVSNIYVRKNGRLYTPPVESGLLGGIMRKVCIKKYGITERPVSPGDLRSADEIYISNSIIGFRKARLSVNGKPGR